MGNIDLVDLGIQYTCGIVLWLRNRGMDGHWIIYLMCGGSMWWDIIYYIRMLAGISGTVCGLLYGYMLGI